MENDKKTTRKDRMSLNVQAFKKTQTNRASVKLWRRINRIATATHEPRRHYSKIENWKWKIIFTQKMDSRERMNMTIITKTITTRLESHQTNARTHTRAHADTRAQLCICIVPRTQMNVSSIECNYYRTVVILTNIRKHYLLLSPCSTKSSLYFKWWNALKCECFPHSIRWTRPISQLWMLLLVRLLNCDVEYDASLFEYQASRHIYGLEIRHPGAVHVR